MFKKNYAAKHKEFMASPLLPFYMHFLEKLLRTDSYGWF